MRIVHVVHSMGVAGAEVLIDGLVRRGTPDQSHAIVTLDRVDVLGERLARDGYPVECVGRQAGFDARLPWRLAKAMSRLRPDVVHSHQYTPYFYSALAVQLVRRRPALIFTEHGRHFPDHRRPKRVLFNRGAIAWTHAVTAVCCFVKQLLVQNEGIDASRVDVIYNGVDAARFAGECDQARVRQSLGVMAGERVVACVARFHPVKDHATLLRGFALAKPQVRKARLVLVGAGEGESMLRSLASELGIAHAVTFAGVRSDIPNVLAASDVFAMTSLSEGASVTVLEAMASGVPTVLTHVGGNPELVEEGTTGALVGREDATAAGQAIAALLDEPARAEAMGRAARARVLRLFTQDRMYKAWDAAYIDALASRRN